MEVVSYTEARSRFKGVMEKVCDDHIPVMITRQNERPVVMMSLEDYDAMQETLYLLAPANAVRLHESFAQAEKGEFVKVKWDDPG